MIRRRILVSLLLILALGAAMGIYLTYWGFQRTETHAMWMDQIREVQVLRSHMEDTSSLISLWAHSQTPRDYLQLTSDFLYAGYSVYNLEYLDRPHLVQLDRINTLLGKLRTNTESYVSSLNSSQLDSLATILHAISNKLAAAYTNFLNYTSAEGTAGPDFWYSGPSPPDEYLLQQAVNLAVDLPDLPPIPT